METKKMSKAGFRLDAGVKRKLVREAKKTGASQAEIVRRILRKHLK